MSIEIGNGFIAPNSALLRRQKDEDSYNRPQSRLPSRHRAKYSKQWGSGIGPGGPISQSAIAPAIWKTGFAADPVDNSGTLAQNPESPTNGGTIGIQLSPQGAGDRAMPICGEIYEKATERYCRTNRAISWPSNKAEVKNLRSKSASCGSSARVAD